jgi:PEGA domain
MLDGIQLIMKNTILLLVFLLGIAAVPAMNAADNYAGGDIVLGGAGPKQITQVTEEPAAVSTTAATLQPVAPSGSLSVTTSPSGANILIDGVQRGISPATIPGLLAGSHTVMLKLDGYQDFSAPVTISAGQTRTLTTTLSPDMAGTAAASGSPQKKSPGFVTVLGLAAIGAVLCLRKST